jgi:hypothetical protein
MRMIMKISLVSNKSSGMLMKLQELKLVLNITYFYNRDSSTHGVGMSMVISLFKIPISFLRFLCPSHLIT